MNERVNSSIFSLLLKLEHVQLILFRIANEFHFEREFGVSVQKPTLLNILGPHSDKPVLTVAHPSAKVHHRQGKLV